MSSTFARVPLDAASRPFVCNTFASSYQRYSGLESRKDFNRYVMAPFEAALDATPPTILALASSHDDLVGWALTAGNSLVYVYVKEAFRDHGVGRSLLDRGLTGAVFQTPAGIRLQQRNYGKALTPRPFMLLSERRAA
jgi:hypothetical protein